MFPIAPAVVIIGFVLYAIAGLAIGALCGWLTVLITKGERTGILKDAFLGSFGFLAGFLGCILTPWPENTVVEQLQGGGQYVSTMSRYQHPERIAIVMAVLFPLVHELYRFKITRTKPT